MADANTVAKEALTLRPSERDQLIDQLISSLDCSDQEIDKLWTKEAEDRLDAYEKGQLKSVSLKKVLEKYK